MYQNVYTTWTKKGPVVHIWDDERGYIVLKHDRYAYAKSPTGKHISIYGDKLKRIRKWDDDEQDQLFEADIHPEMRTLIDLYADSDEPSIGHRVVFFDIEVEMKGGFPNKDNPRQAITSISIYDKTTDKMYALVWDPQTRFTQLNDDTVEVQCYETEYELLQGFLLLMQTLNPTILSGWNTDLFDIPYLYNRMCAVVGEELAKSISPINNIFYREAQGIYKIAGVSSLDYLKLYRKFSMGDRPSYALDAIGELEVGMKKIKYEGTLQDLYESDITKYVEYNVRDVELLKQLDEKLGYIETARALCHKGHIPYENIYTQSQILDGAILTYLKRRNIVAPSKKIGNSANYSGAGRQHISGAFVKDPQSGLHEWVFDIDATSMYPSIIMSLNISPETKRAKIIDWSADERFREPTKKWSVVESKGKTQSLDGSQIDQYLEKNNYSLSANGIMYSKDYTGVLGSILKEWFEERVSYKKKRDEFLKEGDTVRGGFYDRRQYVQKILLNSLYGVQALPTFRFHDLENAEATTSTGQAIIKFAEKAGNQFYNKELNDNKDWCVYIDTDSLFFSAKPLVLKRQPNIDTNDIDTMVGQTISICREFAQYVNDGLDVFAKRACNLNEHGFSFKQEVVGRAGLFITKKRYGMWLVDKEGHRVDKLDVKGMDIIRSNFPEGFKTLLSDVLMKILKLEDKDGVDQTILDYEKKVTMLPLELIAMQTGVKGIKKYTTKEGQPSKGCPVHVRGAINYNFLLTRMGLSGKIEPIKSNEKIFWVYLKQNPYGFNNISFKKEDNPKEIEEFIKTYVDSKKNFKKAVNNKVEAFYGALNWTLPVDSVNTLDAFF
tara:strand:+ start:173 stop:2677 length:2505 start_codon:yes stop_codon:yes gene_type:complete